MSSDFTTESADVGFHMYCLCVCARSLQVLVAFNVYGFAAGSFSCQTIHVKWSMFALDIRMFKLACNTIIKLQKRC